MTKEQPKVLIVMNAPYTSSGSSRTLDSYFHDWDKDRVAQIFCKNCIPTKGHCGQLFQITDASLVKRWLRRTSKVGKLYQYDELEDDEGIEIIGSRAAISSAYRLGAKHTPLIELLRGLLWRKKYWCTPELVEWLDEFKPDCVLYNVSNQLFSQQIALFAAERFGIPIVAVLGDDYYFNDRKSFSPLYHLFRHKFKSLSKRLFSQTYGAVYCSEKIRRKYRDYFHIDGKAIYITSTIQRRPFRPINASAPRLVYCGGIGLGRNLALVEIADALGDMGNHYRLEVYSNNTDPSLCEVLKKHQNIDYGGSIPYSDVLKVVADSDVFVIAEGLRDQDLLFTRYSLSTKAADALSSGVAILTYGPAEAGVVEYMAETGASLVCTDRESIKDSLGRLIGSVDEQKEMYNRAIEATSKNHSLTISMGAFEEVIENSIERRSQASRNHSESERFE